MNFHHERIMRSASSCIEARVLALLSISSNGLQGALDGEQNPRAVVYAGVPFVYRSARATIATSHKTLAIRTTPIRAPKATANSSDIALSRVVQGAVTHSARPFRRAD